MAVRKKQQQIEKKNKFSAAIIILLVVAILWLLLFIIFRNPIIRKTEHVQIFELSYCKACTTDVPETGTNEQGSQGSNEQNENMPSKNESSEEKNHKEESEDDPDDNPEDEPKDEPEDTPEDEPEEESGFTVLDNEAIWGINSTAQIFHDSLYNNRELIAPGATNTYKFIVRNHTNVPIIYIASFEEQNPYNINMKYRLIRDGTYVAGGENSWVSYDELIQNRIKIENNDEHTYYLDWKWFDSSNDTAIGTNPEANYEIKINIQAVQDKNANKN